MPRNIHNTRRAAYKQVLFYVKNKMGVPHHGLKIKTAIRLFASDNKLTIEGCARKWLISLYESRTNSIVRRMNSCFYLTKEWREIRIRVIEKYGSSCMKCGVVTESIHVDHIKPRSLFPELELCFNNLQVLCCFCNIQKSNTNMIDYRAMSS